MEKGGQYLTIDVISRDTGVGDEMRAQITATETMDLVHYVVIGRGDILVAKTLEVSSFFRYGPNEIRGDVSIFLLEQYEFMFLVWNNIKRMNSSVI